MRRSVNIHCGDDDDAWRWCLLFQLYSVGRLNTCKKTFVIRIYASLLQWYIHMYLCDWLGQNNRKFNKQHSMQMPDGFLFTLSVRLSCSWNLTRNVVGFRRVHGKRIWGGEQRIEIIKDRWGLDLFLSPLRCYLNCLQSFPRSKWVPAFSLYKSPFKCQHPSHLSLSLSLSLSLRPSLDGNLNWWGVESFPSDSEWNYDDASASVIKMWTILADNFYTNRVASV